MSEKIKRILAAIIDFYIICFLSSAFVYVFTLGKFCVTLFSITIYLISYFLFLLSKDSIFKNASIGKRIFKLIIIKDDGTKLTIVDQIKRNISIVFLLPVEVILLVMNNRRIGDALAKTSIVFNGCNTNKRKWL